MEFLRVSPDGLLGPLRVPLSLFELPVTYTPAMWYNLVAFWYLLVDYKFLNLKNGIFQLLLSFIRLRACTYILDSQHCSIYLEGSVHCEIKVIK